MSSVPTLNPDGGESSFGRGPEQMAAVCIAYLSRTSGPPGRDLVASHAS